MPTDATRLGGPARPTRSPEDPTLVDPPEVSSSDREPFHHAPAGASWPRPRIAPGCRRRPRPAGRRRGRAASSCRHHERGSSAPRRSRESPTVQEPSTMTNESAAEAWGSANQALREFHRWRGHRPGACCPAPPGQADRLGELRLPGGPVGHGELAVGQVRRGGAWSAHVRHLVAYGAFLGRRGGAVPGSTTSTTWTRPRGRPFATAFSRRQRMVVKRPAPGGQTGSRRRGPISPVASSRTCGRTSPTGRTTASMPSAG